MSAATETRPRGIELIAEKKAEQGAGQIDLARELLAEHGPEGARARLQVTHGLPQGLAGALVTLASSGERLGIAGSMIEDIGELIGQPAPDATFLFEDVIYDGQFHWIAGQPKSGKTALTMEAARLAVERGQHVIWFDWENGKRRLPWRFGSVGIEPEAAEFLHVFTSAPHSATPACLAEIVALLDQWPEALIVFDSASKVYSLCGINENAPGETTLWSATVALPLIERGATIIVIDHTGRNGKADGVHSARGSSGKAADADVSWGLKKVDPFDRATVGRIKLEHHGADRDGHLPPLVEFEMGDGQGNLTVRRVEPERRSDGVRLKVIKTLREHSTPDEPVSTNQVRKLTAGARNQAIDDALAELTDGHLSAYCAAPRKGGGVHYWFDASKEEGLELTGGEGA